MYAYVYIHIYIYIYTYRSEDLLGAPVGHRGAEPWLRTNMISIMIMIIISSIIIIQIRTTSTIITILLLTSISCIIIVIIIVTLILVMINGVNANVAAAKVMQFESLGRKVHPGTFGKMKVGWREYPRKSLSKQEFCSDPIYPCPSHS